MIKKKESMFYLKLKNILLNFIQKKVYFKLMMIFMINFLFKKQSLVNKKKIRNIKIEREFKYKRILKIENTSEYKIFFGGKLMNGKELKGMKISENDDLR